MDDKIGVVVTTIGNGNFLGEYCLQAEREGKQDDVFFYIVDDLRTPNELYEECRHWQDNGFHVAVDNYAGLIQKLGLGNIIPYNSDNRRNIGYLKAVEDGCTKIISLDDDNYCLNEGFFEGHSVAGKTVMLPIIENGWYNVCRKLGLEVYPRGFPPNIRPVYPVVVDREAKVGVNAGLWLGHPDVDAFTWLSNRQTTSDGYYGDVALGKNAWCPVNSQNTAVTRDAMAAYYFIPMGATVQGMQIDRYGDIFQGYFVQVCAKALGEVVRYGTPLVAHRRNSHNYLKDARLEMACLHMLEEFCAWLTGLKLSGSSYHDLYRKLSYALEDAVETFDGWIWTVDAKAYFHRVAYAMRKWSNAYVSVGGQS